MVYRSGFQHLGFLRGFRFPTIWLLTRKNMSTAILTAEMVKISEWIIFLPGFWGTILTWNQIREMELRQCHLITCELRSALLFDRTCHFLHGNRDTLNRQVQRHKRVTAVQ